MVKLSNQHNNSHYIDERVFLLKIAVVLICLPAMLVLYGWLFEGYLLAWLFPSGISMKANSAFCFILASIALVLFLTRHPTATLVQRILSLLLILTGLMTSYQYLTGINLPYIDSVLVQNQLVENNIANGQLYFNRMSPLSGINFILNGLSIFLLTFRNYHILNLARIIIIPVILTAIMVLIGYAYGVRELYRFGFYVPLSPLSAIAFIELSVALMFIHAERGFMRLFVGQTLGSKMVRWLLPTLILVFITIGWLCRQGNLMGWYNNQFEVSMLIFLTLFLSGCLIIWQARAQHGQELLRQRAQHALELNNINLEKKVERRTQELKKLMEDLEALSLTDSLTGLANRRAFEQRLKMEWQRATRYEHPLTVMLIDVDHFKRFNDDFGHQTGDHVLAQVGAILQQAVRTTDLACRYGGEEFVIILPDTPLDDALPIAHRIREHVADYRWEARQVTVSVGVAQLNQQKTPNQLVSDADQALYQAKAAGRNQVIHLA
ncbi:hypothetical protein BKE30_02635 [Alkanindiges hydrocarboniclasticus]|uniref:diguanylate cyclase n=1 Tax=Alkanindiges hydrocarboniclasticus TaxID=1907941 RepID=A0A1S8CYS2_9GAMM|nr:diguanylate cyclase [Alkanindiges hydrocarboniclasticus]ONG41754.1 hypothetical protein BKE30_02635 [Alkanindiges hydrocarboniclasticus]